MQSLLFGNGLNRLTKGNPSWEDLLNVIAKEKIEKNIPNTLRYEAIILKQPYSEKPQKVLTSDGLTLVTADGKNLFVTGEVIEKKLKKDIADRVSKFETNKVYAFLADLPFEHIMTTNYDNTFFKTNGIKELSYNHQERLYSIRRYYVLSGNVGNQTYWPIHGNVKSPSSIMLGFDHYCGELSRIESYVKGNYDLPMVGRVPSMASKLKVGNGDPVHSWIDLFFISDVHIIGIDLAYEEMDLWWILNKRRRMRQRDEVKIENQIVYYPVESLSRDKRQLLTGFDVEIRDLDTYDGTFDKRYLEQLGQMKKRMIQKSGD